MIAKLPLFAAAIASGLVAGIFYGFSSFVMRGLGRIPTVQGIAAMNSINVTVITPSFLLLFMGTLFLCLGLALWALTGIGSQRMQLILAGSLLYVIGCFGVTMVFNVPMNDRLAQVTNADGEALWTQYLSVWTMWNTVRTIAPALSMGLFVAALMRD